MNFTNFDLNLLRILDALLATSSTTEAGRRIGLSQPAVSAALGRLRHALGDPLFVRQGRQLVPTDFAAGLRAPLQDILQQTEQMLSGPEAFEPNRSKARLKISASDFYAEMLMPLLADHLSHLAPEMRVQLVDLVPDNYVQALDQMGVDMAILPRTEFPDWVSARPLHTSQFVVVARSGNDAIADTMVQPGDTLPLDLFCSMQHVLFSPEGNLYSLGDVALAKLGRKRQVAMTLPVFSGVLSAVSQSELIALIPHQLAERLAPRTGVTLYRPPIFLDSVELDLVWHRRSDNTPAHRWLRDQIAILCAPLSTPPSIYPGSKPEPVL